MKSSPLQLEGYFFSRVEMRAHADGDPAANPKLQTVSELGKDSDEGLYLVTLRVDLSREEEGACPTYTGLVEVRGFFRTAPGYPAERCDEMVYVNGSTMLYGAAREMLLNLTSRGPWPSIVIPSVRFVNEDQEGVQDSALGSDSTASALVSQTESGESSTSQPPSKRRRKK